MTNTAPVYTAENLTNEDIRAIWLSDDPSDRALHGDCKFALHCVGFAGMRQVRQRLADHLNAKLPAGAPRKTDVEFHP